MKRPLAGGLRLCFESIRSPPNKETHSCGTLASICIGNSSSWRPFETTGSHGTRENRLSGTESIVMCVRSLAPFRASSKPAEPIAGSTTCSVRTASSSWPIRSPPRDDTTPLENRQARLPIAGQPVANQPDSAGLRSAGTVSAAPRPSAAGPSWARTAPKSKIKLRDMLARQNRFALQNAVRPARIGMVS